MARRNLHRRDSAGHRSERERARRRVHAARRARENLFEPFADMREPLSSDPSRATTGLHFELREFSDRLTRVQAQMQARDIDVLLLTDPCNLYYLSGYDAWSFHAPQALLVPSEGSRVVWVGREMDAAGARLTTWLDEADIEPYGDELVQSPRAHPMTHVASIIAARGWQRAKIGVEAADYYLGAFSYDTLSRALPHVMWRDASLLVNWVRVSKSAAELRYMRDAARIVERAMAVALQSARPGVRQCDVAGEVYRALICGTAEFGGQYPGSPPLMPAGDRADTPHLSWTSQPYRSGSLANFELVAARHRYHTPLARSLYLGRPPDVLRTLEAAMVEGIAAVFDKLRPGMTAADVETILQDAAARHGVHRRARCGYSIGIAYPPTFGEQTVSLRPGDTTPLTQNMTLYLMPAIRHEGASLVISEPFVVTFRGCEPLCQFERRLFTDE